jgi:FkbM family methyltransferase
MLKGTAQWKAIHQLMRPLSQAGFIPAPVWKRLPIAHNFDVILPNGKNFIYQSTYGDAIGRALFWKSLTAWETETTSTFFQLAQNAQVVLDIGANTGVYTLLAALANPNVQVIAFEPVPFIFNHLSHNIHINQLEGRCAARQEAVSNMMNTAQLHVPFGDLPSSSSLLNEGFRGYAGYKITVPVVTIDSMCEHADLVKMDVEGFEPQVLDGMSRLLDTSKPNIIVECNPDGPYKEIQARLSKYGYRYYHLTRNGPVLQQNIVPDLHGHERNYLATVCKELPI